MLLFNTSYCFTNEDDMKFFVPVSMDVVARGVMAGKVLSMKEQSLIDKFKKYRWMKKLGDVSYYDRMLEIVGMLKIPIQKIAEFRMREHIHRQWVRQGLREEVFLQPRSKLFY